MFKPGDSAVVVESGARTTVVALREGQVETIGGVFDEARLRQGHPSVEATAAGSDLASEQWKEKRAAIDSEPRPKLDYELRFAVQAKVQGARLAVDLRGHWKNGAALFDLADFAAGLVRDTHLLGPDVDEEDLRALQKALAAGKSLKRWVSLGRSMAGDGCSYCGARRFSLETNGKTIRLSGEDCPLPEGFEPNEWELNVPSGKILVANDLRKWFPLPEGDGDRQSVNEVCGCRQTSTAYAAVGLSHAFVGNTCPRVFALAGGKFKIANEPADEVWDKKKKEYVAPRRKPKFDGVSVASICTDLWWYSLCDVDEFDRRTKTFGGTMDDARGTVIDVKPGVYRFRHDDGSHDEALGKEVLYATFEWVRDPDPVRDLLGSWRAVEVNAHAYVQAMVKRWPTLYGVRTDPNDHDGHSALSWAEMTEEQRHAAWRSVANHVLCTGGSGVEWHEKGFPQSKVDPEVPDIEPPSFRSQNHWYPFSKPYGGLFKPEALAPSFAKLAFRVLESVISFGTNVRDDAHSRDVPHVRDRMLLAVERYRELAKKYPDLADPDYVHWLGQKGRAEKWVERFDLGPTFTEKHRKHAAFQRWIPGDAYAIEFDARKLKEGYFAWASGTWASKENAERYAIEEWSDNKQAPEHNCFWSCHAKNTAVPLYSVARVVKVGEVSHMGDTLVEIAFDYGTAWMKDVAKRKALREHVEKDGIRVLSKREYEALLQKQKHEALLQT